MSHRSSPITRAALAALAILSIAAVAACSSVGSSDAPASAPPSAPATTAPQTSAPQPPTSVDLSQATGNAVSIEIDDASGTLVDATSGTPGDGASVEPYQLVVTNDDRSTLRLTWVGGPCDATDTLSIAEDGTSFLLVQPECSGDAVAYDRILILEFSRPIAAADVQASIQDGLDTPG
jgi:hypothetical protein